MKNLKKIWLISYNLGVFALIFILNATFLLSNTQNHSCTIDRSELRQESCCTEMRQCDVTQVSRSNTEEDCQYSSCSCSYSPVESNKDISVTKRFQLEKFSSQDLVASAYQNFPVRNIFTKIQNRLKINSIAVYLINSAFLI